MNVIPAVITCLLALLLQSPPDVSSITADLRQQRFEDALDKTKAAIEVITNDPRLWTLQGIAFDGLGKPNDALRSLAQALSLVPDYPAALQEKAQIEYRDGRKEASSTLEQLLRLNPDNTVAHAMLAAVEYKAGHCPAAISNYRAAQALIARNADALTEFGECLLRTGDATGAVEQLNHAFSLEPAAENRRLNLAAVQLEANHPDNALATLRTGSTGQSIRAIDLTATALENRGDTPQAVAALRNGIIAHPGDPDLYLHFASLSFTHASFQVGIDMLNAGLQQLPRDARLLLARGILFVQLGKYDQAEVDFERAEKFDSKQSFSSVAQGLSQLQANQLDPALRTTESKLKTQPDDSYLHYLKAEILRRKGVQPGSAQFTEAIAAARQAVQLKPNFPLAEDLLGSLYLDAGKLALAEEQFQHAFSHDPKNQSVLYHLIVISKKTGQTAHLPALLKQLAVLKAEAQKQEVASSKYRLVETDASNGRGQR